MRYKLLLLVASSFAFSKEGNNYWTATTATKAAEGTTVLARKDPSPNNTPFNLDVNVLKSVLAKGVY
jgi:hypothetical protein